MADLVRRRLCLSAVLHNKESQTPRRQAHIVNFNILTTTMPTSDSWQCFR